MVLCWAKDEGAKVLYKICFLLKQVTTAARVSTINTVDALGVLLENPRLNPQGHLFVYHTEVFPMVAFSPEA